MRALLHLDSMVSRQQLFAARTRHSLDLLVTRTSCPRPFSARSHFLHVVDESSQEVNILPISDEPRLYPIIRGQAPSCRIWRMESSIAVFANSLSYLRLYRQRTL